MENSVRLEVIPAVLTKGLEDFLSRIDRVRPYVNTIHIDMMDGKFVNNKTLPIEDIVKNLPSGIEYEFHWMVKDPAEEIKKIRGKYLHIVHAEAITDFPNLQKTVRENWGKLGIAINPPTRLETVANYIPYVNRVLVMAVNPGFSFQKYLPEVEEKMRQLKKAHPKIEIEVDGGVNAETIRGAVNAGATKLAAASAIFGEESIKYAIEKLYKAAEGHL